MKYKHFVEEVHNNHHQFKYDRAILWGNKSPLMDLTLAMPFKDYIELMDDLNNQMNFMITTDPTVGIIKHISLDGIKVHIVDGEDIKWGCGVPLEDQKFFKRLDFGFLSRHKPREPFIPPDAHDFEVFHIKEDKAFLGFKLANGGFHFVQVPYNPGKHAVPVIQMQTLSNRA